MAKESAGQSVSRNQLVIIGALFVVLLGVVYFLFLKGDGEETAPAAAPAPAPVTAPEENENEGAKKKAPKKKNSKGPLETSEVFGGKDPFEPVVDLTADTSGGETTDTSTTDAATDGTSTTDTSTATTTPTAPTTPTTPTTPVTPPDDDDEDVVKTGYSVRLLGIFNDNGTRKALVETVKRETREKKTHKLVAGERFRQYFKLTSLYPHCASFLDGNEWFGLCEGQRIIRK
jgi:hypothetical protein